MNRSQDLEKFERLRKREEAGIWKKKITRKRRGGEAREVRGFEREGECKCWGKSRFRKISRF